MSSRFRHRSRRSGGGGRRRHPYSRQHQHQHQQRGGGSDLKPPSERIRQYVDSAAPKRAPEQEPLNDYLVNSSPEAAVEYMPALFNSHPELIERIPWTSLRGTVEPSVPQRLVRSSHLFGENYVFVKKENLDFHIMPDNKARKLEFIVGDSLKQKRRKLVTYGYLGSSHCLATVKAASQLSLKSEVVLLQAPITVEALQMVAAMKNLGAKVRLRSTWRGVNLTMRWKWLCSKIFRTQLIPPGGSSELGVLGYVSAMLELRQQIEEGLIPQPDFIFVAVGSGATIVGMEIGRRLAQLDKTKIVGIQGSNDEWIAPERLRELGNQAIQILNQNLKTPISFRFEGTEVRILKDYLFGGHGVLPTEVERWMARFLELESIELDPVYTGKALYGMFHQINREKLKGKTILFWNTQSPFRKGDAPDIIDYRRMPRRLKRWIREEQKTGRLREIGRV